MPDLRAPPAALRRLRRDPSRRLDASIVVPVNAKGDLANVFNLLADLGRYRGEHSIEVILVVNNYTEGDPPEEIVAYQAAGARVISLPQIARRAGDAVPFSVRMAGIRSAEAPWVISFDADCRIPDASSLLDWYVERGHEGVGVAYTHVEYYDVVRARSVRVKVALHHLARWAKREVLGIPTPRGSNYAVRRDLAIDLYDRGFLADELNVGPTVKSHGKPVVYAGGRALSVLTSGRMFRAGWLRIISYFWYRLRYNLRTLPVRSDVASRTGRDRQSPDRYDYTKRHEN